MVYLSVIIPVYNEELRLRRCLDQWVTYLWNYTNYKFEILIVLNGCTDRSPVIAYDFSRLWPQIRILNLTGKGKGLAVRTGMLAAAGRYRYMADVDLSTPPTVIPSFLEAIHGYGMVVGERPVSISFMRQIFHIGFQAISWRLTGVSDSQCGFKLFTDRCAEQVFSKSKVDGWAFDVEAIWLAKRMGFRINALPVPWKHDPNTKISLARDAMQMIADMNRIEKLHPEFSGSLTRALPM